MTNFVQHIDFIQKEGQKKTGATNNKMRIQMRMMLAATFLRFSLLLFFGNIKYFDVDHFSAAISPLCDMNSSHAFR